MKKEQLKQRLKWIEESTNDFINTYIGEDFDSHRLRILNDILIACDLNDDEPEKYWGKPNEIR
mgnify:CR=1 FL=1|tara:strand:- start:72 stop:260 length:189 start_codon:yes stop_codon:yes gene_type:complete